MTHLLVPRHAAPPFCGPGRRVSTDARKIRDAFSTLIRHADATLTVRTLPITVIESTFGTLLVPTVGPAQLLPALAVAARPRAVPVTAIARSAHPEHAAARLRATTALKQRELRALRHPVPQAGLDRAATSWQGPSRGLADSLLGAATETPAAVNGRGFASPPTKPTA